MTIDNIARLTQNHINNVFIIINNKFSRYILFLYQFSFNLSYFLFDIKLGSALHKADTEKVGKTRYLRLIYLVLKIC